MIIDGWEYNFELLPNWNNREIIPYITDELFENKTSDTACIIYSIAEVGMCNYVGFLAVLKNKSNPTLMLNITNYNFPQQNVSFDSTGNLIFLQTHLYNKAIQQTECPLMIVDMKKNIYSYVRTYNYNPMYKIVEQKPNAFIVIADERQKMHDDRLKEFSEKIIRTDLLTWYSMQDIVYFPTKYFDDKVISID